MADYTYDKMCSVLYFYCETNPEQKAIASNIDRYGLFEMCPLLDGGDMSDQEALAYSLENIQCVPPGNVVLQYFDGLSYLDKYIHHDWKVWLANDAELPGNLLSSRQLNVPTKIIPRIGPFVPKNRMLDLEGCQVRVGVTGLEQVNLDQDEVIRAIENNLGDHVVFIGGVALKKYAGHYITREEMKERFLGNTKVFVRDFEPGDVDIMICLGINNEYRIYSAIQNGIPCISINTPIAVDLENRYGCLLTANLYGLGRKIKELGKSSTIDQLHKGMSALADMASPEKFSSLVSSHIIRPAKMKNTISRPMRFHYDLYCMFRNNQDTIGKTLSTLKAFERQAGECRYYIYENDSTDDTPNQIKDFYCHSKGDYLTDKIGTKKWRSEPDSRRMLDLAQYRNKMKALNKDWTGQYSFIMDSEIDFTPDHMFRMIEILEDNDDIAMVTPWGVATHKESSYYDTWALRPDEPLKHQEDLIDVDSAFSGLVCVRTSVFEECHWDTLGDVCEHVHFCQMVKGHGRIVIDPQIVVKWKK